VADQDAVREVRLSLDEAPRDGEIRMLDIGRRRIGLVLVDGELHALADRCPHRAAPLCSAGLLVRDVALDDAGQVAVSPSAGLVRCPWHKWDFDVASGRCVVDPQLRVRRYRVTIEDGEVVVSLDGHG
jgi:3-phenylpropionate/trans-cinnamate dioxygenase ferredoxin subunit